MAIIPMLAFLGFAGAVSLIDFNKYKPQIESEISQLTQRTFTIEGEVDVSVLPFKFSLEKLKAENPKGFEEPLLLALDELYIELSLYQLFVERKIEIISLEAIAPQLNLIQRADVNNWQDIPLLTSWLPKSQVDALFDHAFANAESESALHEVASGFLIKANAGSASEVPEVHVPNNPEHNWYLESVVIKDAALAFINEDKDVSLRLNQANLVTFDVQPHRAFKISSDFVFQHSESPRMFDFDINGNLHIQGNYSQLLLTDWNGIFMLKLPPEENLPDVRFATTGKQVRVDLLHKTIDVSQAVIDGMEAKVITSYKGTLDANPVFEGEFYTNDSNLFNWIGRLGFPETEIDTEVDGEGKGRYEFSWDGKELLVKPITDSI